MAEQRPRGLRPIDDEYQGPSWWHLSRLAEVPRSRGMRRIALAMLVVLGVATLTGILNVTWDWNATAAAARPVRGAGHASTRPSC